MVTRRRFRSIALAAAAVLAFLVALPPTDGPAQAGGPWETAPAPHLTSRTVDRGNGYGQTEWLDAQGEVWGLGVEFRLPWAVGVPVVAVRGGVPGMILDAARRWGLDGPRMLRVARRESRFLPDAKNPRSSASGVFQFLDTTWAWAAPRAGYAGESVWDARANIEVAAWAMSRGYWSWWRETDY